MCITSINFFIPFGITLSIFASTFNYSLQYYTRVYVIANRGRICDQLDSHDCADRSSLPGVIEKYVQTSYYIAQRRERRNKNRILRVDCTSKLSRTARN